MARRRRTKAHDAPVPPPPPKKVYEGNTRDEEGMATAPEYRWDGFVAFAALLVVFLGGVGVGFILAQL